MRRKLIIHFIIPLIFVGCSKKDSLDNIINESNPGKTLTVSVNSSEHIICVIGDTGKSPDQITASALDLQNANCDEIRHVGDIIYTAKVYELSDPNLDLHFLNPFDPFINGGIPIYLSLGNHDYYGDPNIWLNIANTTTNVIFPSSYFITHYSFGLCAITLDSNAQFNDQRLWLNDFYNSKNRNDCKKIIYFTHHPLFSSGSHGNAKGPIEKLFEAYVSGKSQAVFSGHDHHTSYEIEKDGTKYFVTGGFSQLRKGLSDQAIYANYIDYSFIKITIKTSDISSIKVELMKLENGNVKLYETTI